MLCHFFVLIHAFRLHNLNLIWLYILGAGIKYYLHASVSCKKLLNIKYHRQSKLQSYEKNDAKKDKVTIKIFGRFLFAIGICLYSFRRALYDASSERKIKVLSLSWVEIYAKYESLSTIFIGWNCVIFYVRLKFALPMVFYIQEFFVWNRCVQIVFDLCYKNI